MLVVGLGAGAGLVFMGRERFAHDPTRDDLEAPREVLMAQRRDLDCYEGKLDEAISRYEQASALRSRDREIQKKLEKLRTRKGK